MADGDAAPESTGIEMRSATCRGSGLLFAAILAIGALSIGGSARAADIAALRAQADSLMREGRNREAIPVLDEILKATPDDGSAFAARGLAHWRAMTGSADDPDDGFATLQARMCLETQPDCPDVEAALSDLGRATALLAGRPRADALSERARIHVRLGHDALALADDDEAIRLEPDNAQLHEDRAVLRDHIGDDDGARADLDEALRLRPDNGADLVMRADLRRRSGDVTGARADLDEALSHVPPGPAPDWLDDARMLRRAVAAPGETGMGAESGPLTVKHLETTTDTTGRPALSVTFDADSATRLAAYTSAHVGSVVEIVVGGEVVSKPRILSPINGGIVVISGNFTSDEIDRLQRTLGAPGAAVTLREVPQ